MPSNANSSSNISGPVAGRPCILVIDDDEDFRELLLGVLSKGIPGAALNGCATNDEAAHFMEWNAPDVVVMDIFRPGGTAFDFLECFGASGKQPARGAFVVVSGMADKGGNRGRCLALGARCVMKKPFDERQLVEAVRKLL